METIAPLKIFWVDDEPFCLDLYAQYLRNLGQTDISLYTASSDCLYNLTAEPDLIFLDYQMNAMNGIDTLKKIKRFDPNALVVFISGQEEIAVAVNALKYGAFDYLSKKQVNEEKLRTILIKATGIRHLIETARRRSRIHKIMSYLGISSLIFFIHKLTAKL